jgi:hypothetical protein
MSLDNRKDEPDTTWVEIWDLDILGTSEDPIIVSIVDAIPGSSGQLRFRGTAVASGGISAYAGLTWVLFDLVLTSNGDIQALRAHSWGNIKTLDCFQH